MIRFFFLSCQNAQDRPCGAVRPRDAGGVVSVMPHQRREEVGLDCHHDDDALGEEQHGQDQHVEEGCRGAKSLGEECQRAYGDQPLAHVV